MGLLTYGIIVVFCYILIIAGLAYFVSVNTVVLLATVLGTSTVILFLESVEIKPLTNKQYSSALIHLETSGKQQRVCT